MEVSGGGPALGLAYSAYLPGLIQESPDLFDYVEIPFELLRHEAGVLERVAAKPVVLHCASLSIAGRVPPSPDVIDEVAQWIKTTRTPWLGEHFSFVTASRADTGGRADEYAPGEPYNIGYTVTPPFNDATVQRVAAVCAQYVEHFAVPMLVENSPVYFDVPGSAFSQTQAFCRLCETAPVGILLDLAHFYISARTAGFDPLEELERWPLDRVWEIHVSGVSEQDLGAWDDHASRAPEIEMELLRLATRRCSNLRAITLEYNWASHFPPQLLHDELSRVKSAIAPSRRRRQR